MTIKQISLFFIAIATAQIGAMDRYPNHRPSQQQPYYPSQVVNNGIMDNTNGRMTIHAHKFVNNGMIINESGNFTVTQRPKPAPYKQSNKPEITEHMRKLHYPTPEEVAVANEQIHVQDKKIHRLQTLSLTQRQHEQLRILQTLKGDERVTVGDIILQQYDNNPEIQTKIAEQENSFFSGNHHSPHFTEYYLPHPKTGQPVLLGYCLNDKK